MPTDRSSSQAAPSGAGPLLPIVGQSGGGQSGGGQSEGGQSGGGAGGIKRSRTGPWRAAVLLAVHLLIALHILHWRLTGSTLTPVEPSEAMELMKHDVINAGALFFAAAILLTAVFGRFFCGWGCHLVALQDLCRWLLLKVGIRPRPLKSRLLAWVPAVAFTYMFLWPLAYRLWTGVPFSRPSLALTRSDFWATFPGPWVAVATFAVCGFAIIYFLGAKGFCTYACPYGAIFAGADRLAPGRIRVTDACEGCGHCTAVCSSNVMVHREVAEHGMVVSPGCMKCMDCVSVCPNDALYFGFGRPALAAGRRSGDAAGPAGRDRRRGAFRWWEELLLGAAFAAAFFSFRGLYGAVPFLLALGLAAILAPLALTALRLRYRKDLTVLGGKVLKRGGALTARGKIVRAALLAVLLFWGYSALMRHHQAQGLAGYAATAPYRAAALDPEARDRLSGEQVIEVERARHHLTALDRWGLYSPPEIGVRLAWLDLLGGHDGLFRRRVEKLLPRLPDDAALRTALARLHQREGRPRAAAGLYQEALANDPEHVNAYLGLGGLLADAGRPEAALEIFARGIDTTGPSAELYSNVALAHLLSEDGHAALTAFERALALDPSYLPARENLAGLLAGMGRFEDSKRHYLEAVALRPDGADTRRRLARVLEALGEHDAAAAQRAAARQLSAAAGMTPEDVATERDGG